ncbi:MAG TPA: YbjN domain-containing protein [Caulobacteraceae bacterium]|jgi:hypothetical protein
MQLRTAAFGMVAAMAITFLGATAPALAGPLPGDGMTATELAAWLTAAGYAATVKPDTTTPGDQIVSTTLDGLGVDIYLYDCSGGGDARRCTSMQYAAGWAPSSTYSLDRTNEWNRSHRYIKAYLTRGNSLYGEYDLDLRPGGTFEMLNETLANWRRTVGDFKTFFSL